MQEALLSTLWAGFWRRFLEIEDVLNGYELKAVGLSHEDLFDLNRFSWVLKRLLCLKKITIEVYSMTSLKLVHTGEDYRGERASPFFSEMHYKHFIGAHILPSTTTSHQQHQKYIPCHSLTCKDQRNTSKKTQKRKSDELGYSFIHRRNKRKYWGNQYKLVQSKSKKFQQNWDILPELWG